MSDKTIQELIEDRKKAEEKHARLSRELRMINGFIEWFDCDKFTLEPNQSSRLHGLVQDLNENKVANIADELVGKTFASKFCDDTKVFLVRHDWYALLKQEADNGDELVNMPFESCAFEFVINGRPVIVLTVQLEGDAPVAVPFVKFKDGWVNVGHMDAVSEGSPLQYAWLQIRALCIALDAEVASASVIRAPYKLNKKREAAGKLPINDFHIIDLSKRSRKSLPDISGTHRSPRLHFRRGHWRHFENTKTWIKWMLVGDPDLGFIDKMYKI